MRVGFRIKKAWRREGRRGDNKDAFVVVHARKMTKIIKRLSTQDEERMSTIV